MIVINWDFTTGSEISYIEGLQKKDEFETHCLEFFNMDSEVDVLVMNKNNEYILLSEIQEHSTGKEIRKEHVFASVLMDVKYLKDVHVTSTINYYKIQLMNYLCMQMGLL